MNTLAFRLTHQSLSLVSSRPNLVISGAMMASTVWMGWATARTWAKAKSPRLCHPVQFLSCLPSTEIAPSLPAVFFSSQVILLSCPLTTLTFLLHLPLWKSSLMPAPPWHLGLRSSKWEVMLGSSEVMWVLHFWSLDTGLAAPSWWSWSGPPTVPVPQADDKPWSSPAHLQSYLEPEETALEWLTLAVTCQTTVWAVKKSGTVTQDIGLWVGSHCRWPSCLERHLLSHGQMNHFSRCVRHHTGRELQLWRETGSRWRWGQKC